MNAVESALLPVGRDCDCGFPLVWRGQHQHCAVYGAHRMPTPAINFRNLDAPCARLVDELTAMHGKASARDRRQHLRVV